MPRKPSNAAILAQLEKAEMAAEYQLRLRRAQTEIIDFAKLFLPDPEGWRAGNYLATRYRPSVFHHFLAAKLRPYLRPPAKTRPLKHIALSVPAQFGKTQHASIFFPCQYLGNNPSNHVLFATYNENAARRVGQKVKSILESDLFKKIFPGFELRTDSKSAEVMTTSKGGSISFLGRGGSGTGLPSDLSIVDDPIKGQAEAKSALTLAELQEWYFSVMETRSHAKTVQVVIHTRWTVDDLIGILVDPTHPDHDAVLAKGWEYINIPAVNTDPALAELLGQKLEVPTDPRVIEQFGTKPMASLWPERFDLPFLSRRKRRAPRVFESLMQGNPTPDDGEMFTRDMLRAYSSPSELPEGMILYGASDHALTLSKDNDPSCLGILGVDKRENVYVLPDLFWDRVEADGLVDQIMAKLRAHRPLSWFGESDMIGKALGPAIRKRMIEESLYCTMHPIPTVGDKRAKAANIQARMSLGKVYLPKFAPWYARAESQLLKFPNDKNDDFVDFLGIFARGLDMTHGGGRRPADGGNVVQFGTARWLEREARRAKLGFGSSDYRRTCSIRD